MFNKTTLVYIIEVFVAMIFLFFCSIFVKDNFFTLNKTIIEDFNDGWFYIDKAQKKQSVENEKVPGFETGDEITIFNTLPDTFSSDMTLSFYSIHQYVDISIYTTPDEEFLKIYSASVNSKFKVNTPGNHWNFVEIPEGCEGMLIGVTLRSEYKKNVGVIPAFNIGNKADLVQSVLLDNIIDLFFALLLLLCGVLLVSIYVFANKFKTVTNSTLQLGLFAICLALWMATETSLLSMMYGHTYAVSHLSFLSIILGVAPFTEYIKETFIVSSMGKKMFNAITKGDLILFVICLVLHLTNVLDLKEANPFVHLYCGVSLIIILAIVTYDTKKKVKKGHKIKYRYIVSLLLISLPIFNEIVSYNFHYQMRIKNSIINSKLLAVIVMFMLGIDSLNKSIELIQVGKRADEIKKTAFYDPLTKLKNRTAFDHDMNNINSDNYKDYGIVVLDLNNLKYYNDEFGHQAGDDYLITSATIMSRNFSEYGEVYRTGGDEFSIITKGLSETKFEEITNTIEETVDSLNNPVFEKKMGIALGYAPFNPLTDTSLYSTTKRADERMYIYKNEMKSSQHDTVR